MLPQRQPDLPPNSRMPPQRPALLEFCSLAELYLHFETIFLNRNSTSYEFCSTSGNSITVFDRHFFHLVKLKFPGKEKLFMPEEKHSILLQTDGFGEYTCDLHRARYLVSAMQTLRDPDWVFDYRRDPPRAADRVYIKEFDSQPYPYTIMLVGPSDPNQLVPITSYTHKRSGMNKYRRGALLYAKNTTATD